MLLKLLTRLLALFPPSLRETYEPEMRDALAHEYQKAREQGAVHITHFAIRAGLGLTANALFAWVDTFRRSRASSALDLRSIRRSLARAPSFPALVIAVVAVSLAVTTAVAAFYRGTLFREAPYGDPERVVLAWGSNVVSGQLRDVVAGPNFLDFRESTRTLESLAAIHGGSAVIRVDGHPEVLDALEVTVDFLDVLEVKPAIGRNFGDEHRTSSGPDAVIVTHRFWQDRLEADPAIAGTTIVLDDRPHTILGVLDERFEFLSSFALLRPLQEDVMREDSRTRHHYWMVGRLAPDRTTAEASRELSARFAAIADEDDPRLLGWSVLVEPLQRVSLEAVRALLFAVGAAIALVVLTAALNLATLNLIRTFGRSRELVIRSFLGAGRAELARLMLWEAGLLCLAGTLIGIAGGHLLVERLVGLVPALVPIPGSAAQVNVVHARLDAVVLLTAGFVGLIVWAALVTPSLLRLSRYQRSTASAPGDASPRTTGSRRGTRRLVAAELALATVLLIVSGLLERSAQNLLAVDPGVDPEGLLTMYVGQFLDPAPAVRARFFLDVVREVERIPGVVRAGVSDYVPFQGEDDFMGFRLADRPPPRPGEGLREEWRRVSEGFFETAGLSLRAGRGLETLDYNLSERPRVVVVNAAFAAKYWPGRDPLGQRFEMHNEYGEVEIVGVVEDVPARGPSLPPPPMAFVPLHGAPRDNMGLFVRVEGRPIDFVDRVRDAVWRVDASQPIERVHTMTALVDDAVALPRLAGDLVSRFATLALVLAVLGLFGVTSYAVRMRRAELGVRLALGATPARLKRDILVDVTPLAALGIGLGAVVGIAAGAIGRSVLFGVSPADPSTLAASAALVALASFVAAGLPARHVSHVDLASSMREP